MPIRRVLPDLLAALDAHGSAVLTAPPGTGKTTVVPLALAEAGMRVVVAEPRRLAVRAAARRMGVSYAIRGERHTGANPMVEVVTTGVLLQRLQRDQELAGGWTPSCWTNATNATWTPTRRWPSCWTCARRSGPACG
ncbi:hypothetical protein ACFSTC_53370 [Nonomuraea ferruginea]